MDGMSRRRLLTGSAVVAGSAALSSMAPGGTAAGAAGDACGPPPGFPPDIPLRRDTYRNWAGEIRVDGVSAATPKTPDDVVRLADWARGAGYTLRARGYAHGWSPLTVTSAEGCPARVVLVDTTARLTTISPGPDTPDGPTVRVQTGASMDGLLGYLEARGLALTATPAPGDLSVGGALAIGAHGTAVQASGETPRPGDSYGSLSDRVVSLTAVVWDAAAGRYRLRSYARTDPECPALLVHLGRAFLTEVVLRVREDYHLRCLSDLSIPAGELFGTAGPRTLASFVEEAGRVEAIWFPFSDTPWLKVWSLCPERPPTSRPTGAPYNYPFSDTVPRPVAELAGKLVSGQWYLAPAFGRAQHAAALAGLTATASADLWGLSKNLLLYIRPSTLRMHANGYAVPARRADVQRVVAAFVAFYRDRLDAYAAAGRYPVNGPLEIRVTGLDGAPDGPGGRGAPPTLSAVRYRADRPDLDTAVWFDVLTLPGTPGLGEFYREIERFVFGTFPSARPEWSKGWAYTAAGAWTDDEVVRSRIPAAFRGGPGPGWDDALATLDRLDPHRVFSNPFLDALLP